MAMRKDKLLEELINNLPIIQQCVKDNNPLIEERVEDLLMKALVCPPLLKKGCEDVMIQLNKSVFDKAGNFYIDAIFLGGYNDYYPFFSTSSTKDKKGWIYYADLNAVEPQTLEGVIIELINMCK